MATAPDSPQSDWFYRVLRFLAKRGYGEHFPNTPCGGYWTFQDGDHPALLIRPPRVRGDQFLKGETVLVLRPEKPWLMHDKWCEATVEVEVLSPFVAIESVERYMRGDIAPGITPPIPF